MFGKLFASKAVKELDSVIADLKQYLANNYKDQAHSMLAKLHTRACELHGEGKLKDADFERYERIYESYAEEMKNYNHRQFYRS